MLRMKEESKRGLQCQPTVKERENQDTKDEATAALIVLCQRPVRPWTKGDLGTSMDGRQQGQTAPNPQVNTGTYYTLNTLFECIHETHRHTKHVKFTGRQGRDGRAHMVLNECGDRAGEASAQTDWHTHRLRSVINMQVKVHLP